MKLINQNVLLCLLTASLVSACNSGQPNMNASNGIKQTNKGSSDERSPMKLGLGMVKSTLLPVIGLPKIVQIGDDTPLDTTKDIAGQITYKNAMSFEEMINELGIDASIKGSYKDVTLDVKGKFENVEANLSKSLRYAFSAKASGTFCIANKAVPLIAGLSIEDVNKDPTTYGDSFVSCTENGLFVGTDIVLSFDSNQDKQSIAVDGKLNINDLGSLAGSLKKIDSKVRSNMKINIQTVQLGGDVSQMYDIYKTSKSIIQCSLATDETAQKCIAVLEDLNNYMGTQFQSQVSTYLITPTQKHEIKQVKDLTFLYSFDQKEVTPYLSAKAYRTDRALATSLTTLNTNYELASKTYKQYIAFNDMISRAIPSSNPDYQPSLDNLKEILDKINTNMAECYGPVVGDTLDYCKEDAVSFTTELKSQMAALTTQFPWQVGLIAGGVQGIPATYMISGNGFSDPNNKFFVIYTENPAISHYIPGARYLYNAGNITSTDSGFWNLSDSNNSNIKNTKFRWNASQCTFNVSDPEAFILSCGNNIKYINANGVESATPGFELPSSIILQRRLVPVL